jgi:hypothetical protein
MGYYEFPRAFGLDDAQGSVSILAHCFHRGAHERIRLGAAMTYPLPLCQP